MSRTLVDDRWGSLNSPVASVSTRSKYGVGVRALDLTVALLVLLLFGPLMLLIAAMILIVNGAPIFYVHPRRGRDGKLFPCLKFRTMKTNSDAQLRQLLETCGVSRAEWDRDRKLRKDPRIISGGAFLRRMSFDELPQLLNVVRGEMSIVGPRPIVDEEISRYGRYYSAYCSVKPGLTGLWQISGRNNVSYRRRVACDVLYARRKSTANDLRIISCTIPVVLMSNGAY